jgi:hypothetical protein
MGILTYAGHQSPPQTKLFKNIKINVAFKTTNTNWNHLKPTKPKKNIYNRSEIYKLSWHNCPKKYIGQTGQAFRIHYEEHTHTITMNKKTQKYA